MNHMKIEEALNCDWYRVVREGLGMLLKSEIFEDIRKDLAMRDEAKAKYESNKKKLAESFLVTYPDVRLENLYALLDLVEHNVLEFVFTKPEGV